MKIKEQKLRKIVREEVQRVISEQKVYDSKYFRDHLDYFINSEYFKDAYGEQEREFLEFLKARIYQSYPDGDITKDDLFRLVKEPDLRKYDTQVSHRKLINQVWKQI